MSTHSDRRREFLLFTIGISFLFLLICSKSSPFYPLNDWYDTNDFVTLGKGILHGLVPYRDLYEQKGPLLYFLHAIFYLVPGRNYAGVFVMELISLTAFVYIAGMLIGLYLPERYIYIILPVLTALILSAESFCQGGSTEELCAPMVLSALYTTFLYFKKQYPLPITAKALFINGLLAGCILWIKYTLLGLHLAFMACFFFLMISRKQIARAFKSCFIFLGGMAIPAIPVLIYFGVNHALGDLFTVYFYNNMFLYDPEKTTKGLGLIATILKRIGDTFLRNLQFSLFTIIGVLVVLFTANFIAEKCGRLIVLVEAVFLAFFIYTGSNFAYYGYILCVFSVLGFIAIGMAVDGVIRGASKLPKALSDFIEGKIPPNVKAAAEAAYRARTGQDWKPFASGDSSNIYTPADRDPMMNWFSRILLTVVCMVLAFYRCPNTVDFLKPYEDTVQYQFSQIMNEEEDPTLLNYGFLDAGFYEAADILPTEKYFQKQNMSYSSYPVMMDSQDKAVREQHTTFLLLRGEEEDIPEWILDYYEIISEGRQLYEGHHTNYILMKKRDL